MIRTLASLNFEPRMNIRGGTGPAEGADYLAQGEMDGVLGAGRTILAPGSSIGQHTHPDTEELYLILEGQGRAVLDGRTFQVTYLPRGELREAYQWERVPGARP